MKTRLSALAVMLLTVLLQKDSPHAFIGVLLFEWSSLLSAAENGSFLRNVRKRRSASRRSYLPSSSRSAL